MKRKPSPALVISILALFVALSGTSYAAVKLNGKNIKKGTVSGAALKKNTLTGTQINESKLAKVPSALSADTAGNAATLGGLAPSAFATSDQKVITNNVTIATSTKRTILEIPGLFRLEGECVVSNQVAMSLTPLTSGVSMSGHWLTLSTGGFVISGTYNAPNGTGFSSSADQTIRLTVWKASAPDVSYSVSGGAIDCVASGVAIGRG